MLGSKQQARSDQTLPWIPSPVVRFLTGLLDISFPAEFGTDCLAGDPKAPCHASIPCSGITLLLQLEGRSLFIHPLPGLPITTWQHSRTAGPPEAHFAGLGSCVFSFLVCPRSESCMLPLSFFAWLCPSPGLSFTLLSHKHPSCNPQLSRCSQNSLQILDWKAGGSLWLLVQALEGRGAGSKVLRRWESKGRNSLCRPCHKAS